MAKYTVLIPKGDYPARNAAANKAGALLYIDHHFNSSTASANYCLMETSTRVSPIASKKIASLMAAYMSAAIGIRNVGVKELSPGQRGHVCIGKCRIPAVISEPLFVSNAAAAAWIKVPANRQKLAEAEVKAIKEFLPGGGLVALSVGHKYKTSNPNDRGASVVGGGVEADLAEDVVSRVKTLLEGSVVVTPPTTPTKPTQPPAKPKTMPMIRKGSTGPSVKVLQSALAKRGYKIAVDGVFGPKTRWAVMKFQALNRLLPDGVVGPKTWAKLGY